MKIEIWSDFVCPFCYIGKRRLEAALEHFEHRDQVKIEFKSYELDPKAEAKPNESIHEHLALKKGISIVRAKELNERVGEEAMRVGLIYNFDTMQHTNTFDAHRLAKYAETKNLGEVMTEKLLYAYFTDSELISDYVTLKRLALDIGLNKEEVEELLETDRYARRVRDDQELARQIGINGVPFYVFNEKYAISGAQPVELFQKVLEKVWKEERKQLNSGVSKTSYCTGNECDMEE